MGDMEVSKTRARSLPYFVLAATRFTPASNAVAEDKTTPKSDAKKSARSNAAEMMKKWMDAAAPESEAQSV